MFRKMSDPFTKGWTDSFSLKLRDLPHFQLCTWIRSLNIQVKFTHLFKFICFNISETQYSRFLKKEEGEHSCYKKATMYFPKIMWNSKKKVTQKAHLHLKAKVNEIQI
jgi:hypothetical protein